MAYVVDVKEPWIDEDGYPTYDAEGFAEMQGVTVEEWLGGRSSLVAEPGDHPRGCPNEHEGDEEGCGEAYSEPDPVVGLQ